MGAVGFKHHGTYSQGTPRETTATPDEIPRYTAARQLPLLLRLAESCTITTHTRESTMKELRRYESNGEVFTITHFEKFTGQFFTITQTSESSGVIFQDTYQSWESAVPVFLARIAQWEACWLFSGEERSNRGQRMLIKDVAERTSQEAELNMMR